jgi:AcrR family transcriptional regulator
MQAPAQDTRSRIIVEAGRLFYAQGYNNTGLEQIAAGLKLTKPAFYYHFKSKNELALEYLEWQLQNLLGLLGEARARSTSFAKFLAFWAKAVQYQARQGSFYGCPFSRFSGEIMPVERVFFAGKFAAIEAALLAFHAGVANHFRLPAERAKPVGREIMARYTGAAMLYHLTQNMQYLKDLEESFRGIAAREVK